MTQSPKSKIGWVLGLFFRMVIITLVWFFGWPMLLPAFAFAHLRFAGFLLLTMALLGGYTWAVYDGLPFFLSRTKRQRVLVSAVMALPCLAICFLELYVVALIFPSPQKTDKRTESVTFPSGDVLENETYYSSDWMGGERYNRLCLKSANGARELVSEINYEEGPSLFQQSPRPLEFIHGNEKVLAIGQYAFWSWNSKNGSRQWCSIPSSGGGLAAWNYLRSFTKTNDPPYSYEGWNAEFDFDDPGFEHHFLTLRKTRQDERFQFPDYLIFSASGTNFPWEFDLERTKAKNGPRWNRPMPGRLALDCSIITIPNVNVEDVEDSEERATLLARPGAKEVFTETRELSDTNWADFQCSFTWPNGIKDSQEQDVIYGFDDLRPGYHYIFWRIPHSSIPWINPSLLRLDEWMNLDAGGFEGGPCELEFVRLRLQP